MKENMAVKVHRAFVMGRRVRQLSKNISESIPLNVRSVLDVGAGTGEVALASNSFRQELNISEVDVLVRPATFHPLSMMETSCLLIMTRLLL